MASRLTPREIECVKLAGARLRDAEIGETLGISTKTVANHLQTAYAKLGVRDRRRAAERLGILYPGSGIPIPSVAQTVSPGLADADVPDTPAATTAISHAAPGSLPKVPGRVVHRLALILGFAVVAAVVLIGGLTILDTSASLVQQAAPPNAR